jgi:hypothetical protein
MARERAGKPAKARQHLDDAGLHALWAGAFVCSRHLLKP